MTASCFQSASILQLNGDSIAPVFFLDQLIIKRRFLNRSPHQLQPFDLRCLITRQADSNLLPADLACDITVHRQRTCVQLDPWIALYRLYFYCIIEFLSGSLPYPFETQLIRFIRFQLRSAFRPDLNLPCFVQLHFKVFCFRPDQFNRSNGIRLICDARRHCRIAAFPGQQIDIS